MSVTKIGTRVPADLDRDADPAVAQNVETGMCASYSPSADGVGVIIETWSTESGLVTFWRADSIYEAEGWIASTIMAPSHGETTIDA